MFLKAVVFFALLAVVLAERPRVGLRLPNFSTPQVVGGNEASPGDFPYIVSLQWGYGNIVSHFCAGSIVDKRTIVTAAHCPQAISGGKFVVKAGKYNIEINENTEQTVEVESVVINKDYQGGVGPNDIALLKLKQDLVFNNAVQPIALRTSKEKLTSGKVILSGWGSTSKSWFPEMPDKLQYVETDLIDLESCYLAILRLTGSSPVDENSNICTLNSGVSACSGDSGGPLIKKGLNGEKNELIGIVSWGVVPCATQGAPSVYTDVSSFSEWIEKNKYY